MKSWLFALAVAQALDASSTCVAFRKGFVEANPFLPQHCAAVAAIKGGTVMPLTWAVGRKHRKAGKVIAVVGIVAAGTATVINLKRISGGLRP